MPQSIWSGHIRFGLVHIPVRLYSATESRDLSFHLYAKGGAERVKNRRVGAVSGSEIAYGDTVKGYERDDGEVVVLSDDDLASVSAEKSKVLEVAQFCAVEEIDPLYFERSYWLGPSPTEGAEYPFELLRRALTDAKLVGLGTFVMHTKEHVAAIRAHEEGLVLHTMFFADEVRPGASVGRRPDHVTLADRELDLANQLLTALRAPWDPLHYRDEYRHRVLDLIEAKATGKAITAESEPAQANDSPNIADALAASVRALRPTAATESEGNDAVSVRRAKPARTAAASTRIVVSKRLQPPSSPPKSKPKPRKRSTRSSALDELTLTELREAASRAQVPGRSKMKRSELVDALGRVGSQTTRPRTKSQKSA